MTRIEKGFVKTVWEYYRKNGRHALPWRNTPDPYAILVSEMMLQQTQVDRVIPKYEAFLKKYPTVQKLAKTSLSDVLKLWQGLGYNRRARMLLLCVVMVSTEFNGVFPTSETKLLKLPGVGPYTAKAILAFAYNKPSALIETNVRSVYLYHFFKDKTDVTDAELLPYIERTCDRENPREWYYALMDYGSYLKKEFGNPNSKSKHYTKQSTFKNSDRQIRGAVIRTLTIGSYTRSELLAVLSNFEDIRVDAQVIKLINEGLIKYKNKRYNLPR